MVQRSAPPSDWIADETGGTERRTRTGRLARVLVVVVIAMAVIQMGIGSTVAMTSLQTATADGNPTAPSPTPAIDCSTTAETVQTGSISVPDSDRITTDTLALAPGVASVIDVPADAPPVLVVLLGYSQFSDSDPLDHEGRQELYGAVAESPGTYVAEVAATTGLSVSTARYHLRILEREHLIRTEKVRGKRRLYQGRTGESEVAAALNDGATAAVVEAVDRHEPASVSELAEVLDRARSTVTYHVQRLDEAGVLSRERDGGSVRVELTSAARAAVSDTAALGD